MKKITFLIISSALFIGCASKKPIDPCLVKQKACLAECKVKYLNEDFKYKACKAKCYTFYSGCKIKENAVEGYKKTKEFIKEKSE